MKRNTFALTLPLTAESIDAVSEKCVEFLKSQNTNRKQILKLRFSIEEILLKWQARFGEDAELSAAAFFRFGQPIIKFSLNGAQFDPISEKSLESDPWSSKLLSNLETTPVYSYTKNSNTITFKLIRPKRSPLIYLAFAVGFAALFGFIGNYLPVGFRLLVAEKFLLPLSNAYLDVFSLCGIPLIFLSVALGICGVGNLSEFSKIGTKMVWHYISRLILITTVCALIAYPLFSFVRGENTVSLGYSEFFTMFLDAFPKNLIKPLYDNNAIQLVILGAVFGIGILKLSPGASNLNRVLEDTDSLLLLVAEWLTHLIPVFVFFILLKSFWLGEISQVLDVWKSWVVTIGFQLAFLICALLLICIKYKASVSVIIKKVSASFFIALGTNSCTAAIPEIYAATEKIGVSNNLYVFGIPIGTTVFKPSTAVRLVILSYYFASFYGVPVSFSWFVLVVVVSVILSISIPAIPGGTLLFCPMLFSQLGLPAEALTGMLATDLFFDAICTACNQVSVELSLAIQAGKLNLLNRDSIKQ